jgi:hypothetical protein
MEDVSLNVRDGMWFQHDNTPPHFSRQVHNWMNNRFPNAWVGHGFLIVWIPRSPDLNLLFLCYGIFQRKRVQDRNNMDDQVLAAVTSIRRTT